MNTQIKTISLKLNGANQSKLNYLQKLGDTVEKISREFLGYRMKHIQAGEKIDYYQTRNDQYRRYRKEYPELNSAILQDTLKWTDERVKAHIQTCKRKHKLVRWPNINQYPITLRGQLFSFELSKTASNFDGWLRFTRMSFPVQLCDYHRSVLDKTVKYGGSQIVKRNDGWHLQLTCHVECDEIPNEANDKVLGVDLGIKNPIVCSDGKRIGNGKLMTHKKLEFGKKRARHQSRKGQITSKQNRWMKDVNHKLSRRLVDYAVSEGVNVLSLEALKGQHLANKRYRKYTWAFRQLIEFIRYKAKALGIKVVNVDPRYTSQTCNRCGQKCESNRRTRDFYQCESCGARMDADVNAAKNICALSGVDGPPVTLAISKA